MAVRTIECTECGTTVPYGRLSCPSCGELLASVAGAARRLTSLVPIELERTAEVAVAAPAPPSEAAAPEPPVPTAHPVPSVLHEVAAEDAVDGETWDQGWDAPDDAHDDANDAGDLGSLTWPTVPSDPITAAGVDVDVVAEARSSAPAWTTPPFPPQPSITVATPAETPGAYVPPAPVPAVATPLAGDIIPAGLPAPARSWAGSTSAEPGAAAARDGAAARPGAELSLTDPARRSEAIDWIAVAGAALGSVGFLLPWARTIIGADGVGYLDTWGFAGPAHVLVVVGMLAVLTLAVAKTRVPAWVRLGIPGLVLSALLLGLLWPYILGPLGPLPGAYLSFAGALVLGAASVAALAMDRHARADPRV
ncbi:MAG: hypothetical protein ACSLFN_12895 [Candidatus Limnocylindrales bacterium]